MLIGLTSYTECVHNESLRSLLDRHMNDWRVTDESERMAIAGWLKVNGTRIEISGLRGPVVETIQALIATLVSTERV